MAQLVEHQAVTRGVMSSTPARPSLSVFNPLTPRGSPLTSKIVWPVLAGLDVDGLNNRGESAAFVMTSAND